MDALDPFALLDWLFPKLEDRYGTAVAWIVTAITGLVLVAVLVGVLMWMLSNPPGQSS